MKRGCQYLSGLLIILSSFGLSATPKYPLRFVENKGQYGVDILFTADIPSGKMYFKQDRIIFQFVDYGYRVKGHLDQQYENENPDPGARQIDPEEPIKLHIYEVLFEKSNETVTIMGEDPGHERYNYFTGNDPNKWVSGAQSFGLIVYKDIYEGIDLKIYSNKSGLKYDFVLSPGADPDKIQLVYNGLDKIEMKDQGIFLKTTLGENIEKNPIAFQDEKSVKCEFLLDDNKLSFQFPEDYDKTKVLTIDPLLIFSTTRSILS